MEINQAYKDAKKYQLLDAINSIKNNEISNHLKNKKKDSKKEFN